jgi:hypothetical protein
MASFDDLDNILDSIQFELDDLNITDDSGSKTTKTTKTTKSIKYSRHTTLERIALPDAPRDLTPTELNMIYTALGCKMIEGYKYMINQW